MSWTESGAPGEGGGNAGWNEKGQLCFLGRLSLPARSNTSALSVEMLAEEKWRLTFGD